MSGNVSRKRPAQTDGRGGGEGDLLSRIRGGDASALESLMERHWVPLLRYAARMVGSADSAEDVAQEVFVRLWQHRARWEPSSSAASLLYRIAHNLVAKRLRHRGVRWKKAPEIRRLAVPATTPLESSERAELRAAIERALDSLPPRRREAFLLLRYHGLTLAEAAEVMGVSRQTVANHVTMAVSDLRRLLRRFEP